ncbi:MAG: GFA family protein [Steroidobacter sp.]
MTTAGSCLCGAVRYQVDGPFSMMIHCHCSMCRKHHGSAFATFVAAPLSAFRLLSGESEIATYQSSEKGQRSFCRTCGAVTPTLVKEMELALLPAGNLLRDPEVRPQSHVFAASKAPWYTITDSLPQHEEYPPGFDAAGVARSLIPARDGVVEGSCLCGDVAYEITGPALRMLNCHCMRCRRGRSAAHGTNLLCKIEDFRYTRGEAQLDEYKVPEAKHFAVAFCNHCGGAAPRISRERGIVIVPAGPLDVDPGVRPQAHIFVGSKADWFDITDDLPQFAELPG